MQTQKEGLAMALRSMTGFGSSRMERDGVTAAWELRSVNSRFLDIKWMLPHSVRGMEPRLEKVVRSYAQRGRIEASLSIVGGALSGVSFDALQAGAMLDAVAGLAASRGDAFAPDYARLIAVPSLWGQDRAESGGALGELLESSLEAALTEWNASRAEEGRALAADLSERFARIGGWVESVDERAPAIKQGRLTQVRERLAAVLAGLGGELEEVRFLQEAVILADKLDVSEELTRLRAHLARLAAILENGTDAGKKLDFTLQECFREVNTCGNKIQDAQVSAIIVDCKNELEKCREQVQNLE